MKFGTAICHYTPTLNLHSSMYYHGGRTYFWGGYKASATLSFSKVLCTYKLIVKSVYKWQRLVSYFDFLICSWYSFRNVNGYAVIELTDIRDRVRNDDDGVDGLRIRLWTAVTNGLIVHHPSNICVWKTMVDDVDRGKLPIRPPKHSLWQTYQQIHLVTNRKDLDEGN
jgi:hypothetical protein